MILSALRGTGRNRFDSMPKSHGFGVFVCVLICLAGWAGCSSAERPSAYSIQYAYRSFGTGPDLRAHIDSDFSLQAEGRLLTLINNLTTNYPDGLKLTGCSIIRDTHTEYIRISIQDKLFEYTLPHITYESEAASYVQPQVTSFTSLRDEIIRIVANCRPANSDEP